MVRSPWSWFRGPLDNAKKPIAHTFFRLQQTRRGEPRFVMERLRASGRRSPPASRATWPDARLPAGFHEAEQTIAFQGESTRMTTSHSGSPGASLYMAVFKDESRCPFSASSAWASCNTCTKTRSRADLGVHGGQPSAPDGRNMDSVFPGDGLASLPRQGVLQVVDRLVTRNDPGRTTRSPRSSII